MVLNAWVGGVWYHPETWSQVSDLLDRIMRQQRTWFPGIGVGDSVALSISADPYTSEAPGRRPDNYLHVRMNSFTGYGGLIWHVMGDRARATGAEDDQWCWVSDNPSPPSFDPLVLSDPGAPLSFDPRSALPAAQVRAAMEEFSRTATGERPTCVRWVHGQMSGERHDQEQERHHGNVTEPLRQALLAEPAKLQVLGAMRVLRMLPVLSAAGSSIAPAVTEICDVRGRGLRRSLDGPVRTLERFSHYHPELEDGPDDADFRYARMVAVGIALMPCRRGEISRVGRRDEDARR